MKLPFKNFVVWTLIFNLFVASMGFTINVLYCVCKGKLEVSLFDIEDACAKNTASKSAFCCKKSVCHDTATVQITDKHNCTSKSQKFVKLNTEFVLDSKNIHAPQFSEIEFVQPAIEDFQFPVIQAQKNNPNKAPPARPHGKTLLPFIQSFLC